MSEEYLDVLDAKGEHTGQKKLRIDVHRDGDWHRAVHVWILNRNNEVLALQRSLKTDSFAGLWTIGSGGHISAGKSSIETAVEELHEECGLHVDPDQLEFIFSYPLSNTAHDGKFINNTFIDVYLSRMDTVKADITIQPEEVADVKFISVDEIEQIIESGDPCYHHLNEEHIPMLKMLKERLQNDN